MKDYKQTKRKTNKLLFSYNQLLVIIANQKTDLLSRLGKARAQNRGYISNALHTLEVNKQLVFKEINALARGNRSEILSESVYKNALNETIRAIKQTKNSAA